MVTKMIVDDSQSYSYSLPQSGCLLTALGEFTTLTSEMTGQTIKHCNISAHNWMPFGLTHTKCNNNNLHREQAVKLTFSAPLYSNHFNVFAV